jgi:beta-galactosidase GanA
MARHWREMLAAAVAAVLVLGAGAPAPAAPVAATAATSPAGTATAGTGRPVAHTVTWDQYSLLIDGRRTVIWSGEFHPFRLPSPDLWRDVLEKMRADGYNAVSMYFDWGYHSPAPGVYDFSGVRDMDRALAIAASLGLYVIARPGPYINAEVDSGGFPGWLTTQAGRARTDAPDYLAATDEWQEHIDAVIGRHQITDGSGSVIAYQIENELAATGTGERAYLDHLYARARTDGITVPIFHNDKGRNGIWVPAGSTVPGTVPGPVDIYAFDGYPGGTCHTDGTPGGPSAAPDWGIWGAGGARGGASASPLTPGFVAEFGGGWFDYWGSVGTYDCTAVRQGRGYERVFYETNLANRLTMQNFYMTFGGTSWGWLPAPVVYTSYDYGAAIDEARQQRPKAATMRELGYFLRSVAPVAKLERGDPVAASSPAVKVYHDVNPDTGTSLLVATHNPSNATTDDAFTLDLSTPDGSYTVPAAGTLRLAGQDAKMLVAGYDLGGQRLVYSTSEIETHFATAAGDLALLYGRDGEDGETVLRYASPPSVRVLAGTVAHAYDPARGDLRLDYVHGGLAEVRVTGGGRPPLTLLLAGQETADTFWRQETPAGPVLARGPSLVRSAAVRDGRADLRGDTAAPADLEVWSATPLRRVTWNGVPVPVTATAAGSLRAAAALPGPVPVHLPDLTAAAWRYATGSPESTVDFDDSGWLVADHTSTNSTTRPPAGAPVLTADDYGFHHGDVWYRGRFSGAVASLALRYGGGGAGLAQAWLDGSYLGEHQLPTGTSSPPTTGTADFAVPDQVQGPGEHVLAVMVRNDSHNEDGGVNDAQKEGRGLISAGFADSSGAPLDPQVTWRIQGTQGGESIVDTVRGAVNNGGLYGERAGWYLPGYPDRSWPVAAAGDTLPPGTTWYRTGFTLDLPRADDASLGLTIGGAGDPAVPYRALIFVNGWNMGQYAAGIGPQHTFVIPTGILNPDGHNTLAIAVTAAAPLPAAAGPPEPVRLVQLGTVRGGVPVDPVGSPGYAAPRLHAPPVGRATAGTLVTADLGSVRVPPDAAGGALVATVDWGDGSAPQAATLTGGAVRGDHRYARPGGYRVRVRLADRYGGATLDAAEGLVLVRAGG